MEEASGSTPLFGVFILSLYSIFIFPYTLTKLFGGEGDATEVGPMIQHLLSFHCSAPWHHLSARAMLLGHTSTPGALVVQVVKTWSRENDASQPGLAAKAGSKLRKVLTPRMIAMWIAYALLLW